MITTILFIGWLRVLTCEETCLLANQQKNFYIESGLNALSVEDLNILKNQTKDWIEFNIKAECQDVQDPDFGYKQKFCTALTIKIIK